MAVNKNTYLVVAVAFILACTPAPSAVDSSVEGSFGARLAERLSEAEEDGASGVLRITQGGEVLFEGGFGSASCTETEEVTVSHIFMIGSITKELTQVLGYVLEERGLLKFEGTVSDYIPDFYGEIGDVEIGQLMRHTGGLPDLIDESGQPVPYSIDYDYLPVSRDELLERAQLAKLVFEPDSREEYSNLGYQLLAAVYEEVTDESYEALLRQYIFKPAGMSDTDFVFRDNSSRLFADGCQAGDLHWGNPVDDTMWNSDGPSWNLKGAGGLLSTAESLGLFFEGIGNGVYFQSAAQSERYKDDRMVYSDSREQRVMAPAGSNGIFNAAAFWADRSKFSIILMTNRADHQAEDQLFRDVLKVFPATYFSSSE